MGYKRLEVRLHDIDDKDIIAYLEGNDGTNSRLVRRAVRYYIEQEENENIDYASLAKKTSKIVEEQKSGKTGKLRNNDNGIKEEVTLSDKVEEDNHEDNPENYDKEPEILKKIPLQSSLDRQESEEKKRTIKKKRVVLQKREEPKVSTESNEAEDAEEQDRLRKLIQGGGGISL